MKKSSGSKLIFIKRGMKRIGLIFNTEKEFDNPNLVSLLIILVSKRYEYFKMHFGSVENDGL